MGIWEFEKPESITSISLDMGQAAVVYNMENAELYKKNDSGEFSNIDENRKHIITCQQSLGIMLDNEELWSIGNKVEKWSITENKKLLNIDFDGKIDGFIFFAHAEEENYSVYFTDNDAVYGCSKNGTIELLLEWFANDINGQDLTCFGGNGEAFFAGNGEGVLYRIAENVPKGISDGRKIITIATTSDVSNVGFVLEYIEKFNSSQGEYLVRMSTYGKYEDPEERLRIDITTGKIPDIILVKKEQGNLFERLNRKGLLEDLYQYIDEDPDISREDFIENALKLLETNGKLTSIAGNFTIHALIGKKEWIGDRKSWTWEEFEECCKDLSEGSIPYTGIPANIFRQAFSNIYLEYFDLQIEKSFIGAENFARDIKLSEFVCQGKENNRNSMSSLNEVINKVKKGEFYLCAYSMAWMPFVLQPDLAMLDEQQELSLIGYPSNDGTGVSMSFGEQYAITSFSEYKEGAWEFLKKLLVSSSDSVYTCIMGSLPIQKAGYEFNKKCMLAKENYVDKDGRTIYALNSNNIFHITKQNVEMVEQMIEMADCKRLSEHHPLKTIVEEELSQYEREKEFPLEQTIEYIKDRVKIYFSEQE